MSPAATANRAAGVIPEIPGADFDVPVEAGPFALLMRAFFSAAGV